jgi:hypothetical protein
MLCFMRRYDPFCLVFKERMDFKEMVGRWTQEKRDMVGGQGEAILRVMDGLFRESSIVGSSKTLR